MKNSKGKTLWCVWVSNPFKPEDKPARMALNIPSVGNAQAIANTYRVRGLKALVKRQ